jgi:MFS family permease
LELSSYSSTLGGLSCLSNLFKSALPTYVDDRGILNTFWAYQTYYETGELYIASSSNISWIGSVQSSLLLILGLVTGLLYDAGYFHALLYSGSLMILLGQMMTSFCHEYYQALLAQGFCIGIGVGLIFISGGAILSTYFNSRLALANGIAAAGSGLGKHDQLQTLSNS